MHVHVQTVTINFYLGFKYDDKVVMCYSSLSHILYLLSLSLIIPLCSYLMIRRQGGQQLINKHKQRTQIIELVDHMSADSRPWWVAAHHNDQGVYIKSV